MAYPKINEDLSFISKLDDEPNDVGGLSSAELKAEFDRAGNALKDYINNILLPAMEEAGAGNLGIEPIEALPGIADVQAALALLAEQIRNSVLGTIPDRSLTGIKLAQGAVTEDELAEGSVAAPKLAVGAVAERLSFEEIRLTEGVHYGTALPEAGTPGRLFLLKVT